MRLTTSIWLGVFMRLEAQRGAFVSVLRKGAQQAGAVFVVHRVGSDKFDVYGPAPQSMVDNDSADRQFEKILTGTDQEQIDDYLERQTRFDPDLWIIETESGAGAVSLSLAG